MGNPACHSKSFGNPAVSIRAVAFRPCLTAGLAVSLIATNGQFMWEPITPEPVSSVHFYGMLKSNTF
jgi:hypothetical protein